MRTISARPGVARAISEDPRRPAFEVKAYRGSPGILEVSDRARGRMESWQKWSFPCDQPRYRIGDRPGWRPVQKKRRISSFPLAVPGRAPGVGPDEEAGCEVELTEIRHAAKPGGPWGSTPPRPPAAQRVRRPPPRLCSSGLAGRCRTRDRGINVLRTMGWAAAWVPADAARCPPRQARQPLGSWQAKAYRSPSPCSKTASSARTIERVTG